MRAPPLTPLADRRAEGQRQVRAAGLRAGGRAPYGFVLVRILVGGRPHTTLALGDRREVATLRALARLLHRLGGDDPRAVAQALNAQGHRRRGRRWTAQDVRRALATTAYARWVPGWPEAGGVAEAMPVGGGEGVVVGGRSPSKAKNREAKLAQTCEVASSNGGSWRGGDEAFDATKRASRLKPTPRRVTGEGEGGRKRASEARSRGAEVTQPPRDGRSSAGREQSAKAKNRAVRHPKPSTIARGDGLVRRLRCGRCGCTMRQRVTSAKVGEPRRYLACKSGDRGRPCGARWWRREVLEGLLTGELGRDQGGLIEVGEAGVSLISSAPATRPTPNEEGLMEHIVALKSQLERVEAQLAGFSEARSPTEALLERVLGALERMEARGSEELKAVAKRGGDEEDERGGDDGLGALTALVVAALRALVMLVPELPVTGTVAAKILGIQRAKLDGRGVITRSFGRAQVASISEWITAAEGVVPPHPGVRLLWLPRILEQPVEGRRGR